MPQRKAPLDIDLEIYKWRHLIENFFAKLKEFCSAPGSLDTSLSHAAGLIEIAVCHA